MSYYITYGEFQEHMKDYYFRTGSRMQFPEMTNYLYLNGLLRESDEMQNRHTVARMYDDMTDDEFNEVIDSFILTMDIKMHSGMKVLESDIIPYTRDVFIIRHPRYTRPSLHTHNYFEINYVVKGTCSFTFDQTTKTLSEGELCIIAPSSLHDIIIEDDSTIFTIMIRKSTFDTTFFSLMSGKNLLSYFFRMILQDDTHANYLMFFTKENEMLKRMIRNALSECNINDDYSNACCINWVNLLFSTLLRNYSKTLQFYDYKMVYDFSLVLQYIQHNYQTITLSSLAKLFHYSEPYLCTIIKRNTGYSFTELVKRLKMSSAADYLVNTNIKISEIAELVGYNSADHFSRVFRSTYKTPPQEYRKHNREDKFDIFSAQSTNILT